MTTWKRFLTSSVSSTADGSSMMISLMSCERARAMLTICLFAALRCPTSVFGDRFAWPSRRSSSFVWRAASDRFVKPPRGELVPEEDVLGDRQAVDDIQLLVHRGDAELERSLGRGDLDGLAEPGDRAAVGAVDAGERLDEGRLAGAVLSEHAVHFSGTDVEVHSAQRLNAREALRHPSDVE